MGWPLTLALSALSVALLIFSGWRDSRPPDLIKGPRMVPYRAVMLVTLVILIMLIVHMVNLAGVHTEYRSMFGR